MDFGKLYKITSAKKLYLWHILVSVEGSKVYEISSHGEEDGKIVVHKKEITVAKGKKRLVTMRNCNDGFLVAEKDLEERGPGELKGLRQSGLFDFRIVDLSKDIEIAKLAFADAKLI